jgi:hypothetical protein
MLKDCAIALDQLLVATLTLTDVVEQAVGTPPVVVAVLVPLNRIGEEQDDRRRARGADAALPATPIPLVQLTPGEPPTSSPSSTASSSSLCRAVVSGLDLATEASSGSCTSRPAGPTTAATAPPVLVVGVGVRPRRATSTSEEPVAGRGVIPSCRANRAAGSDRAG